MTDPNTTPGTEVRYRHRDLDWLRFNARVLQEAEDPEVPLFERLRFLAIFSSNLDEFFRVRVSKLRQLKYIDKSLRKRLTVRPNKTLKAIIAEVERQQERFGAVFRDQILPELEQEGIVLVGPGELTQEDLEYTMEIFREQIAGNFTMEYTQGISRPFLQDGASYLVAADPPDDQWLYYPCSSAFEERFIALPGTGELHRYIILEDLLERLIPEVGADRAHRGRFYSIKLSRDAELYLEEDVDKSLVHEIYESLKKRSLGQPTRLLYDRHLPKKDTKTLRKHLGLAKIDLVPGGKYHNFSDFMEFPNPCGPHLEYTHMPPLRHPAIPPGGNLFEILENQDILLHFPYQDFEHVLDWVEQAALDPLVLSIDISLYRIASDSRLARALIKALDNGIRVTIFVEAKARFDEENNLEWGRVFESHGATVLYSFPKIKVHSKVLLIRRKSSSGVRRFAYFGTGNFNERTARVYSDHALLTTHEKLTAELEQVFDYLKDTDRQPEFDSLLVSPFNTRSEFERLVNREIQNAQNGLASGITAKMNSLEDQQMIDLLYRASEAGVAVRLQVRGFCCLIPRHPGLSENILVTSVVDRFLEHGRLYLFENQGEPELYMGSADWMTRNLDRRVEVLVPIGSQDVFRELTRILELQMRDNQKARLQGISAENQYRRHPEGVQKIRSQYAIYEYLKGKLEAQSGRGDTHAGGG